MRAERKRDARLRESGTFPKKGSTRYAVKGKRKVNRVRVANIRLSQSERAVYLEGTVATDVDARRSVVTLGASSVGIAGRDGQ